jgi:hypothetical protein
MVYTLKPSKPWLPHFKVFTPILSFGSISQKSRMSPTDAYYKKDIKHQAHLHHTIYPIKGHSIKGLYTPKSPF